MIEIGILIVALLVGIRGILTLSLLIISLRWLITEGHSSINGSSEPKLYIVIPALREQIRILPTLDYFINEFLLKNSEIIVVTSDREFEKSFHGPSTYEIVTGYIKKNRLAETVKCINYPNKHGIKADQLNYVLKGLKDENSFIAIYDADSRPDKRTVEAFRSMENENHLDVFQQSAIFTKNFDHLGRETNWFNKNFLRTCAILQTRWTFTHEIPRLLRQSGKNSFLKKYANAHVVGHGLFTRIKTIKQIGGFPADNLTEDLYLGYLFRARGVSICPMPLLDVVDSPSSIKSNFIQKYVWFWGPMKYIEYYRHATQILKTSRFLAAILSIQGLISALAWLLSGPFCLLLLVAPIFVRNNLLTLTCLTALFIYGPLQYFISYFSLKYIKTEGSKFSPNLIEGLVISLMSIPVILFHSVPPYYSLYAEFKHKMTNEKVYKPKTDD